MAVVVPKSGFISVIVGIALLSFVSPILAHDGDHAALEARVAKLEALVEQLSSTANTVPIKTDNERQRIEPSSSYGFGGYIKFDSMFSDYSGGDLEPGSPGSQFYIPSTIPVGGAPSESPAADIQGRESRIYFRSDHELAGGDLVSTYIETDFFVGPGGNERVSNSFNPRLRHAFFKYNNWLFGQTWSTFQDIGALPENLDFIGPAESTTFVRQAQVRYTRGPWEFSAENPETTITPFGGGTRVTSDDGTMPDLVGRYSFDLENGNIKAALLLRELSCTEVNIDDSEVGFGLSLSGKHRIGQDDVRWMATAGQGTGRYLGLNTANDAVLDSTGDLVAIDQWGAFVSLRHFWTDRWRSNLTLGYLNNDHDTALTGTDVTKDVYSVHLNLLYEPLPKMTFGGEILFAERTLESDDAGDMTRLLLSAKYAF
jgi:hypothetical protein